MKEERIDMIIKELQALRSELFANTMITEEFLMPNALNKGPLAWLLRKLEEEGGILKLDMR